MKNLIRNILGLATILSLIFGVAAFAEENGKKSERFNGEGPVKAVDAAAKTLTITIEKGRMAARDLEGQDQVIDITDETRIRTRDVNVGLGEIIIGSRAKIKGRKIDEKFVADKIDIKVKEIEIKGEIKSIDAASRTIKALVEKAKKLESVEGTEIDIKVLENAKITKADEKVGFDALKIGDLVNLKIFQEGDKYFATRVVVREAKVEEKEEAKEKKERKSKRGEPSVTNFEVKDEVRTGKKFKVSWRVNGPKKIFITHTAVHYGSESKPGDFGLDVTPAAAGYSSLTSDFASGSFKIPKKFKAEITASDAEGTLYMRAHAIIDGKHYWTAEKKVSVVKKAEEEKEEAKETLKEAAISITASGFSPASVEISKGGKITWKNNDTVDHQPASAPHPVHTDLPVLGNGKVLTPGEDFSVIIDQVGVFGFHDHLNPSLVGTITVK